MFRFNSLSYLSLLSTNINSITVQTYKLVNSRVYSSSFG